MYLSSNDLHDYFKKEIGYFYELDIDIKNAIFDDNIKPPKQLIPNNDAEKIESLIQNVLIRGIGYAISELKYKQIRFNVSDRTYKRFKNNNIDANKVSDLLKELKVHELYQQSKKYVDAKKYVDEYVFDENDVCSPLEKFFLNVQKLTEELIALAE